MIYTGTGTILLEGDDDVVLEDALEFYLNVCDEDYREEPEANGPSYESKLIMYYQFTGRDFDGPHGQYTQDGVIIGREVSTF